MYTYLTYTHTHALKPGQLASKTRNYKVLFYKLCCEKERQHTPGIILDHRLNCILTCIYETIFSAFLVLETEWPISHVS